jgi:hypothetical protein
MIAIPVGAVKPTYNLAAAEEVAWHVSAEVGPVPPYGDGDILGSDTSSKLIVNQPKGNTEVAMTGVMNGLNPNTVYTVLLSKGYFTTPVYWPGLFTSTIPTFTFTTDEYGSGSWHITLRDTIFTGAGTYALSVWVNSPSRTILISNTFTVVVGE